jgi:hypothetical protein
VTELTSPAAIVAVAVLAAMGLLGLGLIALELRRRGAE